MIKVILENVVSIKKEELNTKVTFLNIRRKYNELWWKEIRW
nr:MAG TPA: hypothetical protein [Podoviridae sp. ctY3D12]